MTLIAEPKRKSRDLQLVEDIKSGIPSKVRLAQEQIYKEYHPIFLSQMLRNTRCEKDAEDLAIQALAKALVQIHKFNVQFALSTWMQTIARNLLIDFKRKKTLNAKSIQELSLKTSSSDIEFEIQDDNPLPIEILYQEEQRNQLNEKLDNISIEASHILSLRYFEELTYNEISEKLQMPIGTVKAKIYRAKEELQKEFFLT